MIASNRARSGLDLPLSPLRFLARAAEVHPDKVAVVDGERILTYRAFAALASEFANALKARHIGPGDRIAFLTTNSLELLVAHYAVPLIGAVLVAINTRLSPAEVGYICDHSGAAILVSEADLLSRLLAETRLETVREIVVSPDASGQTVALDGAITMADFLTTGRSEDLPWEIDDEERVISINYTSGTTGRPKGVMYTHRGAYLAALGVVLHHGLTYETRYLWSLPMFHCNGWCKPWALAAVAATQYCLRAVRGPVMWDLIDKQGINCMAGAPTVVDTLVSASEAHGLAGPLTIICGGAPPSPAMIAKVAAIGGRISHIYGLTETYGPFAVGEAKPEWQALPIEEQATLLARQGVAMVTGDTIRVVRAFPDKSGSLVDVARDGTEIGEVVMRGNLVMKGYYQDDEATEIAFAGGWFRSGDLGVMQPDGYIKIMDRAKDVIISGGENISTIEIEHALSAHPDVVDVAVIGVPDEKWGERPIAILVVADIDVTDLGSRDAKSSELIDHLKRRIAGFKVPDRFEFTDALPKTATGKVRKNELRALHGDRKAAL
ncbi:MULTISPECIES: AMP-binding protein [unclassified Sphingomonas]|uniref:AMP-binding protein n=1 Tax=unclassified Sphingomonas TaxID=196159 RepID=UPI0006FA512E|nr:MULTISPECIES: AMP-binding protein [unclassified Sphingomonas]KQX24125.1 acyl-CoA synthetase [Sphingomonas sp. Root1294]KQY69700.1 acyl-CoA synthetase [Sphingomonas sp. Root50]KRB92933.1 acyl-CoA synthetase [Sphingomonas sp. Root720]